MKKALSEIFQRSQTCLLFCGGLTIAVAKLDTHFYTFDSHSRGKDGLLNQQGTAVLMVFDHLDYLMRYIEELFLNSLKLKPSDQFELVPVNITQHAIEGPVNLVNVCSNKMETVGIDIPDSRDSLTIKEAIPKQHEFPIETEKQEANKCMESYFEDQSRRQKLFEEGRMDEKTKLNKRNEYMKNYMKKRREKETIKKRENDSARSRMQKVRSTSEGKQKNKERSVEGMRKYLESENGRMKHNQLSAETMRKRLCTSEGRSKHNERSAESMRNMLKDDEKRLKHRIKSVEAMRNRLADEQKKSRGIKNKYLKLCNEGQKMNKGK